MADDPGRSASLDRYLSDLVEKRRFSGSAFLAIDDRPVFDASYEVADRGSGRAPGRDSLFQIASVSKQITAAAILLLQQQGVLSVRDPLSKWVPDSPPNWATITLHHLLTHSAGLPHWGDIRQLDLFQPNEWATILAAFSSRPLKFPPGSGYSYSSPGYHLLARVVEAATGERYAVFLRQRIFSPLGMTRTFAGNPAGGTLELALGYEGDEPAASYDLNTTGMGAGDVWSTTSDLFRWDRALAQPGTILTGASLSETFRPHVQVPEDKAAQVRGLTDVAYGYGWGLAKFGRVRARYHDGGNSGYRSLNLWAPEARTVIVILSNQGATDVIDIGLRTLELCVPPLGR